MADKSLPLTPTQFFTQDASLSAGLTDVSYRLYLHAYIASIAQQSRIESGIAGHVDSPGLGSDSVRGDVRRSVSVLTNRQILSIAAQALGLDEKRRTSAEYGFSDSELEKFAVAQVGSTLNFYPGTGSSTSRDGDDVKPVDSIQPTPTIMKRETLTVDTQIPLSARSTDSYPECYALSALSMNSPIRRMDPKSAYTAVELATSPTSYSTMVVSHRHLYATSAVTVASPVLATTIAPFTHEEAFEVYDVVRSQVISRSQGKSATSLCVSMSNAFDYDDLETPIFVYGPLMYPNLLAKILCERTAEGISKKSTPAILRNFSVVSDHESRYPTLVPESVSYTAGILVNKVSQISHQLLFQWFSSRGYHRQIATVRAPLISDEPVRVPVWLKPLTGAEYQLWDMDKFTQSRFGMDQLVKLSNAMMEARYEVLSQSAEALPSMLRARKVFFDTDGGFTQKSVPTVSAPPSPLRDKEYTSRRTYRKAVTRFTKVRYFSGIDADSSDDDVVSQHMMADFPNGSICVGQITGEHNATHKVQLSAAMVDMITQFNSSKHTTVKMMQRSFAKRYDVYYDETLKMFVSHRAMSGYDYSAVCPTQLVDVAGRPTAFLKYCVQVFNEGTRPEQQLVIVKYIPRIAGKIRPVLTRRTAYSPGYEYLRVILPQYYDEVSLLLGEYPTFRNLFSLNFHFYDVEAMRRVHVRILDDGFHFQLIASSGTIPFPIFFTVFLRKQPPGVVQFFNRFLSVTNFLAMPSYNFDDCVR